MPWAPFLSTPTRAILGGMKEGDLVGERFAIESVAGSGGMGTVYRAIDRTTQLPAAVKVMTRGEVEDAARFLQEAEVLRELRHPHIVQHLAHGTDATGSPFL